MGVGAGPEINDGEIWDPMGFSKLYDRNFDFNMAMTYPHVQWLREAEIKHGRVCMLAFTGMVVQSFFPENAWIGQMDREPGDLGFDPLKFSKKPGFDIKKKQLIELKNGRLAMIGVASIFANHAIPGSVPFLTGAF